MKLHWKNMWRGKRNSVKQTDCDKITVNPSSCLVSNFNVRVLHTNQSRNECQRGQRWFHYLELTKGKACEKKYWDVSKSDSSLHRKITTQIYSGRNRKGTHQYLFLTWKWTVKFETVDMQKLNGLIYGFVWGRKRSKA